MAGISIISNFDLSANAPIDYRILASNSTDRDSISYKYVGLKTYLLSDNLTYTWDGLTWSFGINGIYGGSGSLIGDTEVNLGSIGTVVGSQSNALSFVTTATDNSIQSSNKFIRTSVSETSFINGLFDSSSTQSYISLSNNYVNINNKLLIYGYTNSTNLTEISLVDNYSGKLLPNRLNNNRNYFLPDRNGEIALTSSIPSLVGISLETSTTYGNTSSKGFGLSSPGSDAYALTVGDPYATNPSYSVYSTYNPISLAGMYYRLTVPKVNLTSLNIKWAIYMRSYTESNIENAIQFNAVYNESPTGGQLDSRIQSATLSSNRSIYFPNNSGTVSLTSNLSTGTSKYNYILKTYNGNLTISSSPYSPSSAFWSGATGSFLVLQTNLTGSDKTVEIPAPSSSNVGQTLIIKANNTNAGPPVWNYISTIPFWVNGATQNIFTKGVTSLISDGTRWTRWAFSDNGLTSE